MLETAIDITAIVIYAVLTKNMSNVNRKSVAKVSCYIASLSVCKRRSLTIQFRFG